MYLRIACSLSKQIRFKAKSLNLPLTLRDSGVCVFYAWMVFKVASPFSLWICYFMIWNKKLNVCLMIESYSHSLNKVFLFVLNMEASYNELVVLSCFSFTLQATRWTTSMLFTLHGPIWRKLLPWMLAKSASTIQRWWFILFCSLCSQLARTIISMIYVSLILDILNLGSNCESGKADKWDS